MHAPENSLFTSILITAVILGIILIYFFISIIRQQRKNMQLNKRNILAEITQIEKERARIAADLHDEMGPLLAAVKMKISSFDISNEDDELQVEKTNQHIDDVLKRMREISFNLMPNSLLRKGLASAVKEFVDYLNTNSGMRFYVSLENDLALKEENAVNIYRLIQEVIYNTIKHAKATELSIEVKNEKNNVVVRLSDDGVGFDYEKESKENIGFGLRSLLRRTEIMSGQMFIESGKDKGTKYTFEIPR